MEIKDLKPNAGSVDLVLEVVDKDEPRTFEKFGKTGSVCNAKVKDETGEVKMTLWNEDIEKVKVGDKIHIENGWCSEFRDELQISSGKFGKIEVVEAMENNTVLTNDPKMLNPDMPEGMEGADEAEESGVESSDGEETVEEEVVE
jgi:replication factor A1